MVEVDAAAGGFLAVVVDAGVGDGDLGVADVDAVGGVVVDIGVDDGGVGGS